MSSYVYFFTDDHGHIKIGKANNVYFRLCELQTGNPYKLRILLSVQLPSEEHAYQLEQALHRQFQKDRMEGEWFHDENILELLSDDICLVGNYSFPGRGFHLH